MNNRLTKVALHLGIAVPVLYFGVQLISAPFFPEYSFADHAASLLGSKLSTLPVVFNLGAVLTGSVGVVASFGFLRALQKIGAPWFFAWLACILLLLMAAGTIWAGVFPMPDPRHGANPFGVAFFAVPFLLPMALWRLSDSRALRIYFVVNVLLFGVLFSYKSGLINLDILSHEGFFQRILALIAFVPIGVSAYALGKRL